MLANKDWDCMFWKFSEVPQACRTGSYQNHLLKFNREWLHLVYENKSSEYWAVELCEDFNDQTKG